VYMIPAMMAIWLAAWSYRVCDSSYSGPGSFAEYDTTWPAKFDYYEQERLVGRNVLWARGTGLSANPTTSVLRCELIITCPVRWHAHRQSLSLERAA
jgi:hypothetical protein